VDEVLNGLADTEDWAALIGVLRRVLAGDRDPETLLADLDPVDTAIVTRLLDALAGRVQLAAGPIRAATAAGAQALVDQWEPMLAAILAATTGDQAATQQVDEGLNGLADTKDWAALVGVLRRVLAGDRDPETLLADLDPVDTAIATRLLDALAGRVQLSLADPPEPSDEH
jgi:Mg-chelatase subunit ChlI